MHARRQIRESIAAMVTGLASTGARVHQSRMRPQGAAGLPCLLVTTNDEDVSPGTIGNLYERSLTVVVRGFAVGSTTLDDDMDQIALEVETALAAYTNAVLDKLEVDFDDELEKPVGSIAMTYKVSYYTAANSPGTLI